MKHLALLATTLFTLNANAATFVLENGTILGISDVELGGAFYDVEFVDGSCIDLFSGCDGAGDFPFNDSRDERDPQSAIAAALALEALLHPPGLQILGRVAGCDVLANCEIMTPTFVEGRAVQASITFPDSGSLGTTPLLRFIDPIDDLSQDSFEVYARWTLIPEPSVAVLVGLGLGLFGLYPAKVRPGCSGRGQATRNRVALVPSR
ncbi:MAG: hypothetical protein IPK00_12700 [Deltaproteobacteria bacterium]|nr:hypothetical protein [Deltaproteobacteria bacterium]